jgi:Response regulator containing a CheY-like receiver domain and an HTH DNA-binding domain
MDLVGAASSGEQAINLFRRHRPNVTLMDLQLPAMSGLAAIRAIRSEFVDARIVVVTMFHGEEDIYRALESGAMTYVLKDVGSDELLRVVREVHAGARPIPNNVAALLATRNAQPLLTLRELEVMEHLGRGMKNRDIALALNITEETVKVHVKNILAKLNVNERGAAVSVAIRRGIIHLD